MIKQFKCEQNTDCGGDHNKTSHKGSHGTALTPRYPLDFTLHFVSPPDKNKQEQHNEQKAKKPPDEEEWKQAPA